MVGSAKLRKREYENYNVRKLITRSDFASLTLTRHPYYGRAWDSLLNNGLKYPSKLPPPEAFRFFPARGHGKEKEERSKERFPFNPKFREFWLVHQMERTTTVWSHRNIRNQLWRWSTLTDLVILVGRTEMFLSFILTKLLSTAQLFCIWLQKLQDAVRVYIWAYLHYSYDTFNMPYCS